MDWTKRTSDPLNQKVQRELKGHIKARSEAYRGSLLDYILDRARGASVLHVGFAEHSIAYIDSPNWKHRIIDEVASNLVGVDINEECVKEAINRGYQAHVADVNQEYRLSAEFDIVIAADVIEHLDSPAALLTYCRRAAKPEGGILITTPNPYYFLHIISAVFSYPQIPNMEHVTWISEANMLELCRRQGVELSRIVYVFGGGRKRWQKFVKRMFFWISPGLFCGTIAYLVKK
ncbi:MAG: class I SAM-dependent methyltransferase [Pseudomonadota bacterium]